jgi:titin
MRLIRQLTLLLIIMVFLVGVLVIGRPVFADSYTVTNTDDGGANSLRSAIIQANGSAGGDTISFAIPPGDPNCIGGVCTITLAAPLPVLTGGNITIAGYSQPGASPASGATPADLRIVLDGSGLTSAYGFEITSANNVIKGLVIQGFDNCGVWLKGPSSTGDDIHGNHIGTNVAGTSAVGNGSGVCISQGASGNTVGGDVSSERNVISGNGGFGVSVNGEGTDSNIISANYIGVTANGNADLGNGYSGVSIVAGAAGNVVGGASSDERNIISGNGWGGVEIEDSGTDGNQVYGNHIGTNRLGTSPIANGQNGVLISDGAQSNTIGGASSGFRNVISGNTEWGIAITAVNTDGNTVSANYIGVNAAGDAPLNNGFGDVRIYDSAKSNTVGGDTAGERNVISGVGPGVSIGGTGTIYNTVSGNYIGPNAAGDTALSASNVGVYISSGASYNTIGGDSAGEGNLISGQGGGVVLENAGTIGNTISGNMIGTDHTGTVSLGNISDGVQIRSGPQDNTIGGDTPGERNVISGNGGNGVSIGDFLAAGTSGNVVTGNYIGTDITGSADLGNSSFGVVIDNGAINNSVGGSAAGTGNVISGNGWDGISISDADTTGNVVQGNYIGTDVSGMADLGNDGSGVSLFSGTNDNTVGPANPIAFNGAFGVNANGATTIDNVITQNSIFENNSYGINLQSGAHDGIIAPTITSTSVSSITIQGTATDCAGCTIEVFSNPVPLAYSQGKNYVGSTAVVGTSWSLTVPCISDGYLTATATHATKGTSEFSNEFTSTVSCVFLPLIMR